MNCALEMWVGPPTGRNELRPYNGMNCALEMWVGPPIGRNELRPYNGRPCFPSSPSIQDISPRWMEQ